MLENETDAPPPAPVTPAGRNFADALGVSKRLPPAPSRPRPPEETAVHGSISL